MALLANVNGTVEIVRVLAVLPDKMTVQGLHTKNKRVIEKDDPTRKVFDNMAEAEKWIMDSRKGR